MRSQSEWASKHRNGRKRARAIVIRQEHKFSLSPGSKSTVYRRDRENARRLRQIERGQLKVSLPPSNIRPVKIVERV